MAHGRVYRNGMPILKRLRAAARRHPLFVDGIVALLSFAAVVLARFQWPTGPTRPGVLDIALLVAGCAALILRRRAPWRVFAATLVLTLTGITIAGSDALVIGPLFVALYTIATLKTWPRTVAATLCQMLVLALPMLANGQSLATNGQAAQLLNWSALVAIVGFAVRSQRAVLASADERARQAEITREEEALRQVAEERVRIARELHDVMAHNVAVISVQSGVASHLIIDQPEQARDALDHVQTASATILTELSTIVGLLRQPNEAQDTAPTPGLGQLDALLGEIGNTGLLVRDHRSGASQALPTALDLAAYRIVQESLTNAHKHGDGEADLSLVYRPQNLVIEVTNRVRPHPVVTATPGGHGLIGLRERVHAAGGTVTIGLRKDGKFAVKATLPIPRDERSGSDDHHGIAR